MVRDTPKCSCFRSLWLPDRKTWADWYFSWQSWFRLVFLPVQRFSWCTLHIGWISRVDNIQPWCTPFPTWNQSVVPCPVLTVDSWPAYRFLKRQVRWSGIPISFRIFHILLWSTQSKALAYSVKHKNVFFWNSPFPWSSRCWQFDLWFLCLF